MKKIAAALALALGLSFGANAAMAKQVIIANGCDFPLTFVGITTPEQTEAENLLSAALAPGDGIQVDLNITKGIDITIQDDDNAQLEFSGLDLSNVNQVTVRADGTAELK